MSIAKLAVLLAFSLSFSKPPVISEVQVKQRPGTKTVDIYYTVEDDDSRLVYVSFMGSSDCGRTWNVEITSLEGDTGLTEPGPRKNVIWNAGKDYPGQYSSSFKIQVVARDKLCPKTDDLGMVYVPEGRYPFGDKDAFLPEYCIDGWEYPNTADSPPRTTVNYTEAVELCQAKGKALCTELQWEAACRGKEGLVYPYGMGYVKANCNTEGDSVNPIGADSKCASRFGVYDLSGNVLEWVVAAEAKTEKGKKPAKVRDPDIYKTLKGGNYYLGKKYASCSEKQTEAGDYGTDHIGFRCCYLFPK